MVTRHPTARTLWPALLSAAILLVPLGACGDDDGGAADASSDAGVDANAQLDATPADAGPDGGLDAGPDGSVEVPLPGFGTISGDCGFLEEPQWSSPDSMLFRNAIDFGAAAFDYASLSPGGQEVWDDGNLGGTSLHSEVFSYEVLYRCELAELLKTEGEILYQDDSGKKTDLLVLLDARKVGVSVTRAFKFPPGSTYLYADAWALLTDKCADVLLSAANADPVDAWERSMLHIIAYDADHADVIETAYAAMDATLLESTLLVVTVTDGTDDYIY